MRAGPYLPLVFLSLFGARGVSQEGPPLWPDAAAIEEFLRDAEVTERVEIGEGITKPEKVTLELDGKVMYAVFKNVEESYDSWRFEVAAYRLDRLLELGMVPPTVERSLRGRKGCLQLWVTGVTMEDFEGSFPDPESWRRQVSLMWLFDDLICNIDRHLNNAIVSPEGRLMLIDNSKTFRPMNHLVNDLNGPGTGTHARFWLTKYDKDRVEYPVSYPADFIERFRAVSDKQLKQALRGYVWGYAADQLIKRRKILLERLADMGEPVLVRDR